MFGPVVNLYDGSHPKSLSCGGHPCFDLKDIGSHRSGILLYSFKTIQELMSISLLTGTVSPVVGKTEN